MEIGEDQSFLNTLFMFDCHIYGDYLSDNISNMNSMEIKDDTLIMCYAPHSSQTYIERTLSPFTVEESREFAGSLANTNMQILFSKSYKLQFLNKRICLFITYSITTSIDEWIKKTESRHNCFDVDLLHMSRSGLSMQKLPPCLERLPNPFLSIFNNCLLKKYMIIVDDIDLVNEKTKDMILSRIYDKKKMGWKNKRVASFVPPPVTPGTKCSICLETLKKKDCKYNSGVCIHTFHFKCMEKHIMQHLAKGEVAKCPMCRKEIPVKMI